jgi:glycosyltransferase involved in cell wall biosynthesis
MKLIIQIPCFNEEATLADTYNDLPKAIEGIDSIETQIVDDGSTDRTLEVARTLGIDYIISFKQNKGLAAAFRAGVANAVAHGADILVNTDGDNQYVGSDIPKLVQPILSGQADMVIGARPIDDHPEFSFFKKRLQNIGSWTLRKVSKTSVPDAASGFRAYSKDALMHINVFSDFSYCMETLIQAGLNNLKIKSVDVRVNAKTRDSRLFRSIPQYVWRSAQTIVKIFLLYRSGQVFSAISGIMFVAAIAVFVRYFYRLFFFQAPANAFWPSIILASTLLTTAFVSYLVGIICSHIAANRKLLEEVLYRLRVAESKSRQEEDS